MPQKLPGADVSHKPRIAVFALGGTIAMTRGETGAIAPSLSGAALVAAVPGLTDVADIAVHSPLQKPGASLTISDILAVASEVRSALANGANGAVVVQGTDTIEETAFLLDCVLETSAPVVVTGAMRGPEAAGADGPANLLASAIVAASGARNTGVLVVLGDTAHAARHVRKGHTARPDAFTSAPFGPLGYVFEGQFRQYLHRSVGQTLYLDTDTPIPPVALLQIGLGDDGRMLRHLPEMGFEGAVIAAMGAGHVPQPIVEELGILADTIPVVLSSRVATGPVFENTYGFPGSEIDLLKRNLVPGGSLGPLKARLLLQLGLAAGHNQNTDIQKLFVSWGNA
ncbi:asparaginase [Roseibaca sp. V10]|uniref:Asparaginase n=1 Tax=Roseinatronobacter domitianus TaxID=2940293 RepID=A0ABT0M0T4_9RHOB|nr:asparaginase [Roseibaca domitiana]MCL1627889.1 asparaginase [Roseibaca domitiana]